MACDVALLERGAVCLALYPYSRGFPLDRVLREVEDEFAARLDRHEDIESIARTIGPGDSPEVVVTMKLRRVLLLQDSTSASREDAIVARINSITPKKRERDNWYRKVQSGTHPAHYLIGGRPEHGTSGEEAYVDLLNVSVIRKATILRRAGALDEAEMRDVSELLIRTLELDLSQYLANYAARLRPSEADEQAAS